MKESNRLLEKHWGFNTFRPLQEDIIQSVINGKDTLALLPTGGGKSICYQIPGLAREGICIVISPLIALMNDQVNQLEAKGIKAKAISSAMSYKEIDITLDNAKFGDLDFLYVSPERLQTKIFIERFKQMQISLIVVDEAHCISEWGHDFRPPYLLISDLRIYHPETPIIAVTATATELVKQDIITKLQLKKPEVFEASFHRNNISYEIYQLENKEDALLKWIKRFPDFSGIIYCQTRKSVKDIANYLHYNGIKSGIYHGGLDSELRRKMMSEWMSDETPIMVATNAFGMGIDKPNVRYIIHFEFPTNLEAYFQEAGRAGRDGKESRTLVFYNEHDIDKNELILEQQFPPIETIKKTYRALCNFLHLAIGSGKNETFPISINELCKSFKLDVINTYQSLKILELNGDIIVNETINNPTKIKFAIGNTALYSFQIKYDRVSRLIQYLSRTYPGIFDHFFRIDEETCANKVGISKNELENQLKFLEQNGVIDITWRTDLPKITFLHERLPDDYMQISKEVYSNRKNRAIKRWELTKKFLKTSTCREQYLLEYFGQKTSDCGKCDICREKQKTEINDTKLLEKILEKLSNKPLTLDELKIIFKNYKFNQIQKILQKGILEETIIYSDGKYKCKTKP
jgi:ATP-dependent DNA helicase RecQ